MYEYIIMIKIPFESGDDPDARKRAQEILKDVKVPDNTTVKLQRLEQGRAPQGIVFS
jgi:hypothetical protein